MHRIQDLVSALGLVMLTTLLLTAPVTMLLLIAPGL